jgi:hypothetical protein
MKHIVNTNTALITTSINIPAYDATGDGLIVTLRLTAIMDNSNIILTIGNIAENLKHNFQRIVEIMSSINKFWKCLENYTYILECENSNFVVKDTKSSSMAISIALLNIYREILAKPQIQGLSGTGILRMDGTFENSRYETKKYQASVRDGDDLKHFITANECNHLFELGQLMGLTTKGE